MRSLNVDALASAFKGARQSNPFCDIAQSADTDWPMLVLNTPQNQRFQSDFSFERTLKAIVDSNGGSGDETQLMQSLLYGFGFPSISNNDSVVERLLDIRGGELALDAASLVAGDMVPTAVFNRLDLAAADGSHCGEQRIVYHFDNNNQQGASGRFFF